MSFNSCGVPTFTDPPEFGTSGVVCVFKSGRKDCIKIFKTTVHQFRKWTFLITSKEPKTFIKKQLESIQTEIMLKLQGSCVVAKFSSQYQKDNFDHWVEKCFEITENCFRDLELLYLSGSRDDIQHIASEIKRSNMVVDDSLSIFQVKDATGFFLLGRGENIFDIILDMQTHLKNIRICSPETEECIVFDTFTMSHLQFRLNRVFKGTERTVREYPYIKLYQSGLKVKLIGNENNCAAATKYLKANSWTAGIHTEPCKQFDCIVFFLSRKNVKEFIDRKIATINGTWALIKCTEPESNTFPLIYGKTRHDTEMVLNILLQSVKTREYCVINSTDMEEIVQRWKLYAENLEKRFQGKFVFRTNTQKKPGFMIITFIFTSDLENEGSLKKLVHEVELRTPRKESIPLKPKHFIWLQKCYLEFLKMEAKKNGVSINFVKERNVVEIAGLSSALKEMKDLIHSIWMEVKAILLPFASLPAKVTDFMSEYQCCFEYRPYEKSRLLIKGNTGIVVYKGKFETDRFYADVYVKSVESEQRDMVIEWSTEETALLKFPLWRGEEAREKNQTEALFQLLFSEVKERKKKYVAFDLQDMTSWPVQTYVKSIVDCVPKPPEGLVIWISHPDEIAFHTVVNFIKEAEYPKTGRSIKSSKIEFQVIKGRIAELPEKVDVIVNTTSLSLDMTSGAVSASILKVAGDDLKTEIANFPADNKTGQIIRVNYGDVAETLAYRLNCQRIFHGALYKWKDDPEKALEILQRFLKNCICLADNRKFKTIAFPAIGTGQLKIPAVEVASCVRKIVDEYAASHTKRHVEKIIFVIYEKDVENFKVFQTILEHGQGNFINLLLYLHHCFLFIEEIKKQT